jgi:4a-hydroxytetrahydrobiopterin dehydratase
VVGNTGKTLKLATGRVTPGFLRYLGSVSEAKQEVLMGLKEKDCVPCRGGIPPMSDHEEDVAVAQLSSWTLERTGVHRIRKEFRFATFRDAIGFVDMVADLAEEQGHHPNIEIRYSAVVMELYTHKIEGLHENDFILASKIDDVFARSQGRL